jgi:type I restriction enzyme S subunit
LTTDWPEVALGDHVDILTGFPFKSQDFTRDPQDVPLLKGSVVAPGNLVWNGCERLKQSLAGEFDQYRLQQGDVILALDRPWIEAGLKFAWIRHTDPEALLVQRVARLRGTPTLDTTFLRYIIGGKAFADYIAPITTGVNVPHISPSQVAAFKFKLPPLETQQKIAAVLSAYDDLIENNRGRIGLLEEMVQRIYREWFVEFRYPGHDDVPLVESAIGEIPVGWRVAEFGDCASVAKKTLTPSDRPLETFRHFSIPAFDASQMPELAAGSTILSNKFLIEEPSVLYSKLNPRIPRVWWADPSPQYVSVASTELLVMTPRPGWNRGWLRAALADDEFGARAAAMAGGTSTSHQRVKPGDLLALRIALPPMHLVDRFSVLANRAFGLTAVLRSQNATARDTREFLIPRLVSGELDVEHLHLTVEEAAA